MHRIHLVLLVALLLPGSSVPAQSTFDFNSLISNRFTDSSGQEVVVMKVPGKPPDSFRMPEIDNFTSTSNLISEVPAYHWSFGCMPTAAAMMAGFYDRNGYVNMYAGPTNGGLAPMDNSTWGFVVINGETRAQCPLSATRQGVDNRTIRGHVDDYWINYSNPNPDPYITNNWTQHAYADCTGDFMKTSQSVYGLSDGATWTTYYGNGAPYSAAGDDGNYGLKLFFESRGYTITSFFTQLIHGYNGNTLGFTFDQYKQEIDAGRPVIILVTGHAMLGFGYDSVGNKVFLHDTWDFATHQMVWGDAYAGLTHFAVGTFTLQPVPCIVVTSPNGGESWPRGSTRQIKWNSTVPDNIKIELFKNGVLNASIVNSMANTGSYQWTIPSGQTTGNDCMIKITSTTNGAMFDFSNANFSITDLPAITTTLTNNITQTTAKSGGTIVLSGSPVTARGVCWSEAPNPTTADFKTLDGTGVGTFISNLTGLTGNTVYYVRAYATNSSGTSYGNQETFVTAPVPPIISTTAASNILLITATSGGKVSSDGGANVTARGVCWSLNPNPTTANSKTADGSGTGIFVSDLTNLTANTVYHAKAYAINSIGTSYGDEITFSTLLYPIPPSLTTATVTNISHNTATSGGDVVSDGGAAVTSRGVCWGTSQNPVITGNHTTDGGGTGAFVSSMTDLVPNTLYYIRAYANNVSGTSYGNMLSFTTLPAPIVPVVTTSPVTGNIQNSATSGGNVVSDGGALVTSRGVCWSTNPTPLISDSHTTDGMGTGMFLSNLTGLTLGVTYYVRAYAVNIGGIVGYGSVISFATVNVFSCGMPIAVNHLISGGVAPVDKIATYNTVKSIPGEPLKCWIASNLGASRQATAVNDNTEASAGWYWQFNRKQGFKHDGSALTPAWAITSISGNSDWIVTFDPCNIELANSWRIPTYTEWNNVDNTGGWTNWNGLWNSNLKLHAAGSLNYNSGSLGERGSRGYYWSSSHSSAEYGWHLQFNANVSVLTNGQPKAAGFALRCIRDSCSSYTNTGVYMNESANPVCAGSPVTFTATPINGGTTPQYKWKKNGTVVTGATNATYTCTPGNGDVITCLLNSNVLCPAANPVVSNAVTMVVNPWAQAGISISVPNNSICSGRSATFTATPVNGGAAPGYQWKKGGTAISGATNSTYTYIPANGDILSCVLTSFASCVAGNPATSNSITMTVKTSPVPTITGITTVATGTTGMTYTTQSGMTGYTWTISSGGAITNGLGTNIVTVSWNSMGTQNISVNYTNTNGCTALTSTVLPVNVTSTVPPAKTLTNLIVGTGQTNCYNATQIITVAGNGTLFLVLNGANATFIAGQRISFLPGTTFYNGSYIRGYIAPSGPFCVTPSLPATVSVEDEITAQPETSLFKIYPNPTSGNFILEFTGEGVPLRIDIFGMWGEKVLTAALGGDRKREFSLSGKPAGVYFIRLLTGEKAETMKIIKE